MSDDVFLCVGGPKDGARVRASGTSFKTLVFGADSSSQVLYHLEMMGTPNKTFGIWRPDGQTLEQTIELLFEGYRVGVKPGA